ALAGGRGAPAPVLPCDPRQLVRLPAVRPFDQRVAADKPARAGVGEVARRVGAGDGTPRRPVGRLGLVQHGCGNGRGAPAGGKAHPEVRQLRQAAAKRRLLQVHEPDPVAGGHGVVGTRITVQQRVSGGRIEPPGQVDAVRYSSTSTRASGSAPSTSGTTYGRTRRASRSAVLSRAYRSPASDPPGICLTIARAADLAQPDPRTRAAGLPPDHRGRPQGGLQRLTQRQPGSRPYPHGSMWILVPAPALTRPASASAARSRPTVPSTMADGSTRPSA